MTGRPRARRDTTRHYTGENPCPSRLPENDPRLMPSDLGAAQLTRRDNSD